MDFEGYVKTYYGSGPLTASRECAMDNGRGFLPERVLRKLAEFREQAECNGCGQRIAVNVTMATRGAKTFHESCARKHDERQQQRSAATPIAPTVIGTLEGVAVLLGESCGIPLNDTCMEQEQFTRDAFDRSIERGGQELKLDHSQSLRGRFRKIASEAGELRFVFDLFDGVLERSALAKVKAGTIRSCSIAFRPVPGCERYIGTTLERSCVDLNEITLVDSDRKRAAWVGTWVTAR